MSPLPNCVFFTRESGRCCHPLGHRRFLSDRRCVVIGDDPRVSGCTVQLRRFPAPAPLAPPPRKR